MEGAYVLRTATFILRCAIFPELMLADGPNFHGVVDVEVGNPRFGESMEMTQFNVAFEFTAPVITLAFVTRSEGKVGGQG